MNAHIGKHIPEDILLDWMASSFGIDRAAVGLSCENVEEETWPPLLIGLQKEDRVDYPLFLHISGDLSDRRDLIVDQVQRLRSLCRYFQCQALTSDDSPYPNGYMVHIDPQGNCSWVAVDPYAFDNCSDLLEHTVCNAPEGYFFTSQTIDELLTKEAFSKILNIDAAKIRVDVYEYPILDITTPLYSDSRYPIIDNKHFNQAVTVSVQYSRREWIPNQHDMRNWVNHVLSYARMLESHPCIGHIAFETLRSIPGGSDLEKRCYFWDGQKLKTVIYKSCRERW